MNKIFRTLKYTTTDNTYDKIIFCYLVSPIPDLLTLITLKASTVQSQNLTLGGDIKQPNNSINQAKHKS